jgi:uncharacterized membrane protein YqiK
MIIDANKIDAAASATLYRRYSFVRTLAIACALTGLMSAAQAGPRDKDKDEARQHPQAQQRDMRSAVDMRQRQPERQYEQRQFDGRAFEARGDEQRRQIQMQEQNARAEALRRNGRMTADERRDLRRQINEAGLDIYPNTPRR